MYCCCRKSVFWKFLWDYLFKTLVRKDKCFLWTARNTRQHSLILYIEDAVLEVSELFHRKGVHWKNTLIALRNCLNMVDLKWLNDEMQRFGYFLGRVWTMNENWHLKQHGENVESLHVYHFITSIITGKDLS